MEQKHKTEFVRLFSNKFKLSLFVGLILILLSCCSNERKINNRKIIYVESILYYDFCSMKLLLVSLLISVINTSYYVANEMITK